MSCNWEDIIQKFQTLSEEYSKLSQEKQSQEEQWESRLSNGVALEHLETWKGIEESNQHYASQHQDSIKLEKMANEIDSLKKEAQLIQNNITTSLNDVITTKGINELILNYINLPIKNITRQVKQECVEQEIVIPPQSVAKPSLEQNNLLIETAKGIGQMCMIL